MTRIRHITKAEASRYLQKKCSFLLLHCRGPLKTCRDLFMGPWARAARLSGRCAWQAAFAAAVPCWLAKGRFADKAHTHTSMEPTRGLSAASAAGFTAS